MRHVREQRPVSLLLFDLDHFKSVNDRFGHAAGDEVLVTFCRIVEEHLRPTDIFARLGGEEFVSLLPGSSPTDAWTVAERLRKVFGGTPHRFNDAVVHCTLSVGLSSTNAEIQDLFGLLTNADHALYRAKHSGRNRSVAQSSSPPRRIATSGKL
jgi:diguanylate cyclase (GGDEF)-like protein